MAEARPKAATLTNRWCYRKCDYLPRYTPEELYAIVSNVDKYAEFVPFCAASRVLGPANQRDTQGQDATPTSVVEAELVVGFSAVRESYTSEVSMRKDEWVKVRGDD